MLRSYSFMKKDTDIAFYWEVWNEIQGLKWYFYKFAKSNAEEAMQKTFMHALFHFSRQKGNLSAYIKKLAREITKSDGREVLVDFLENTLSEEKDFKIGSDTKVNTSASSIFDFSSGLIDNIANSDDNRIVDVSKLALESMGNFIMLCEALIKSDTETRYYPKNFIQHCLRLTRLCSNFNKLCLDVYMEYGDSMKWFLSLDEDSSDWKEPDFAMINSSYSKRVQLINRRTEEPVYDADLEPFKIKGRLGTGVNSKKVVRANYYDLWEYMCDLIDAEETNTMKFIIGDNYIVRTFGGSYSVLDPDLYNEYDIVRMEILTNVMQDTCGKVLNIGSENMYLLCSTSMKKSSYSTTVHGYSFEIRYEDVLVTA